MSSDNPFGYISPADWSVQELIEARAVIADLQRELAAEARINGMGGEREARLMAIVAERESEILLLKEAIRRLAQQDATLSVCDGDVVVTMDARLTAAERQTVEQAITLIEGSGWGVSGLRDLLKRCGE